MFKKSKKRTHISHESHITAVKSEAHTKNVQTKSPVLTLPLPCPCLRMQPASLYCWETVLKFGEEYYVSPMCFVSAEHEVTGVWVTTCSPSLCLWDCLLESFSPSSSSSALPRLGFVWHTGGLVLFRLPSSDRALVEPLFFDSQDLTPSTRSSTSESVSVSSPLWRKDFIRAVHTTVKIFTLTSQFSVSTKKRWKIKSFSTRLKYIRRLNFCENIDNSASS